MTGPLMWSETKSINDMICMRWLRAESPEGFILWLNKTRVTLSITNFQQMGFRHVIQTHLYSPGHREHADTDEGTERETGGLQEISN